MIKKILNYSVIYVIPTIIMLFVFPMPGAYAIFLYVLIGSICLGFVGLFLGNYGFRKMNALSDTDFFQKLLKSDALRSEMNRKIKEGKKTAHEGEHSMPFAIAAHSFDLFIYYTLMMHYPAIAPVFLLLIALRYTYLYCVPTYLKNQHNVYSRYRKLYAELKSNGMVRGIDSEA